jgi:fatty acid desaturase
LQSQPNGATILLQWVAGALAVAKVAVADLTYFSVYHWFDGPCEMTPTHSFAIPTRLKKAYSLRICARTAFTGIAAAYVISYLLFRRVCYFLSIKLSSYVLRRYLYRIAAAKTIRNSPRLSTILSSVAALVLLSTVERASHSNNLFGVIAGVATLPFVLWAFIIASSNIDRWPSSLDAILSTAEARWPERWFKSVLQYPQDAHFVRIVINNTIVVLPAWLGLVTADLTMPIGFFYVIFFWLATTTVVPSHEMLDHTDIHNHLFRPRAGCTRWQQNVVRFINFYLRYVLNPLCLRIPNFYRIQHIYVHHVEDNGPADTQTTLFYDRNSYLDFCRSSLVIGLSFSFGVDVACYLLRKRKVKPLMTMWFGMTVWYGMMLWLCFFNWQAALVCVVVQFLNGVPTTAGAFSWHAFVDLDDFENIYRNTVNMTSRNGEIYGGIYHIEHHLNPGMRWHDLAKRARELEPLHLKNEGLQFWKQDWFGFHFVQAIWLRRYDFVASWCLRAGDYARPVSEVEELIRRRLMPLFQVPHGPTYQWVDEQLGRFVAINLIDGTLSEPTDAEKKAMMVEKAARKFQMGRKRQAVMKSS